jgi:heat shock protein HtpX
MASLSNLKFAMGTSIFVASFIFGIFLFGIIFVVEAYIAEFNPLMGVSIAVSGTVLFILFEYLVGPAIVSASTHLHYLKLGENPWLESTVQDLASRSGLPMPRLATVPNRIPNAFTFGRTSSSATLAVHEGLLSNLNQDEVRGVLAHELGHIKHKDYVVMTVLSALPLLAYLIAQFSFRAGVFTGRSHGRKSDNSGAALIVVGVVAFVVYIISFLAVMRLSRLREHYADSYSAYLTGNPHGLQSALTKITYGLSIAPNATAEARSFYIEDPTMAKQEIAQVMEKKNEYDLDHDGVLDENELEQAMEKEARSAWVQLNGLFATHPPTFKRILLLREIEKEMVTGQYSSDRMYAHV